jgi:hypothetical protein
MAHTSELREPNKACICSPYGNYFIILAVMAGSVKHFAFPLILVLAEIICAQQPRTGTGEVRGVLTDPYGALVPQAKIVANRKNATTEEKGRTAISNVDGEFYFSDLPFGVYMLESRFPGFDAFKKRVEISSDHPTLSGIVFLMEGCGDIDPSEPNSVTASDKGEIVRQTLTRYLPKNPDAPKQVVSTENIKLEWLGDYKAKVAFMRQSEINRRGEIKGFPYLQFSELKIKGSCVEATISELVALPKDRFLVDNASMTYEFRKIDGHWIKRLLAGSDYW